MTKDEFIQNLIEELELETSITMFTKFKDLEEWDSMGAMVLIGYVSDNFGLILTGKDIENLTDVQSLIDKIGSDKFL